MKRYLRLLRRKHGGGSVPAVQCQVLAQFQEGLKAGQWKRAKEIQQWLQRLSVANCYFMDSKCFSVLAKQQLHRGN